MRPSRRGRLILLACASGTLWLRAAPAEERTPQGPGNPDRGAAIAHHGTASGVPACEECHSVIGQQVGEDVSPALAGQSPYYLAKQLKDFATGQRQNPVMTPIAEALSSGERSDVAAFYASRTPPALPLPTGSEPLPWQGRILARAGDREKAIQACNNCHGPDGAGEWPAIPYLAGQSPAYLALELRKWRTGLRRNDGGQQMAVIAGRLDDADIDAVAAYFAAPASINR